MWYVIFLTFPFKLLDSLTFDVLLSKVQPSLPLVHIVEWTRLKSQMHARGRWTPSFGVRARA